MKQHMTKVDGTVISWHRDGGTEFLAALRLVALGGPGGLGWHTEHGHMVGWLCLYLSHVYFKHLTSQPPPRPTIVLSLFSIMSESNELTVPARKNELPETPHGQQFTTQELG